MSPDHLADDHAIAAFKWVRGDLISESLHGKVYAALNATGETIAAKQVEIECTENGRGVRLQTTVVEMLTKESSILRELDHPNVVLYLGFEETPRYLTMFVLDP